jgi:hypothetical protein
MESTLRIFIGSSSEGLPVARAIAELLAQHHGVAPSLWNEGSFELSKTYIESLETELTQAHFAILVLTPDDVVVSREEGSLAPRDNLLFELGLFMGRLGRERCFLVHEKEQSLKLPSDLLGVRPAGYAVAEGGTLRDALTRPAGLIAQHIRSVGPRAITPADVTKQLELAAAFATRLVGAWWQRFQLQGKESISFFQIAPDPVTNSVQLSGDAYRSDGGFEAHWDSVAVRLAVDQRKLYYSWEGTRPRSEKPTELFRGFGEFKFDDAPGIFMQGTGSFSDVAGVSDTATWKSVALRRATSEDDVTKMTKGRDAEKAAVVLRVLQEF